MNIDLNSDLGESYGPWSMGDDAAMLSVVTSANIACGGHASDPETMYNTLRTAAEQGVVVGAHPGYADPLGFGRRIIPMSPEAIGRMIVAQTGSLVAMAKLSGTIVRYLKPHGALGNLAGDDAQVAEAIVLALKAVAPEIAILAISGTELEHVAKRHGVITYSEVFADRAYTAQGKLVPRSQPGAVLHDPAEVTARMMGFIETGLMPVLNGDSIELDAHSICVHGDTPGAVSMAKSLRSSLESNGVSLSAFIDNAVC